MSTEYPSTEVAGYFTELRGVAPSNAKALGLHKVARTSSTFWAFLVESAALATCGLPTVEADSEQTGRSALLTTLIATLPAPLQLSLQWGGHRHSRGFPICFGAALLDCVLPLSQQKPFSVASPSAVHFGPLFPRFCCQSRVKACDALPTTAAVSSSDPCGYLVSVCNALMP